MPGEAVAAEGRAAARPAIGAAAGVVAPGAWRCASPWKGYQSGEVVAVPAGTAGSGDPPRALVWLADGCFLFLEYVRETSLDAFMKRANAGEAQILSIKTNIIGDRERSWTRVVEEKGGGMPTPRICPAWVEAARADMERESALSRTLPKARKGRASLAKKDGK